MEPTFFDALSIWIRNKERLETVDKEDWPSLQKDIIENVFGGFDSLMHCLLQDKNTLNIDEHNQLYQTLDAYSTESVVDHGHKSDLCITSVNDDCILHIATFLNETDRHNMKQSCRLFALTMQQQKFMKTVPYIDVIIQGIESNDKNQQLQSLELYNKYMKQDYHDTYCKHIRKYNPKTFQKFVQLVLDNKTNKMCQEIGLNLLKYECEPAMVPLVLDMFNTDKSDSLKKLETANSVACIDEPNVLKYIERARESIPELHIKKMLQLYSLKNIQLSVAFLKCLTEHKGILCANIFNCTDSISIDGFKRVVIHNFNLMNKFKDSCNTEQKSETKDNTDTDLTTGFIDVMIEMITDDTVAKHWENMEHFFAILYEYALLGQNERNYLIDKQLINILGDFFLGQNASPYANDEKQYVVMGNRMVPPRFDAVLQIICALFCACHTQTTKLSLEFKDIRLHPLSEKDQKLADCSEFYNKIIRQAHHSKRILRALESLVVHWCYDNTKFSDEVIRLIDEGIDKSGADQVKTFLALMHSVVRIEDSLQNYRFKQLHSPEELNPSKGALHYIKVYRLQHQPFTYECMKAMTFMMIGYGAYGAYMVNRRKDWVWWDAWLDTYCHRPSYIHNQNNERLREFKVAFFVEKYVPFLTKHGIECNRAEPQYVHSSSD